MSRLARNLDRASVALRRSAARVRRGGAASVDSGEAPGDSAGGRRRGAPGGAIDQSIAALRAVVWIAAFVQGVFNEIRGRTDEL